MTQNNLQRLISGVRIASGGIEGCMPKAKITGYVIMKCSLKKFGVTRRELVLFIIWVHYSGLIFAAYIGSQRRKNEAEL